MVNKLKVSFNFDLAKVNDALGNTPNVDAKAALMELLKSALSEYGSVDNYGDPIYCSPQLLDHVSFSIIEE